MALKVGELYASFGIDSSGIDSAISGIEKKCSDIASGLAKTGAVLTAGVTTPIVAFAKEVYQVGSEFQAQMSRVQSIAEATDTELAALTQTAKDLGASSSFSASQAAEGMEFLASAGFKVEEIIAAMPGMLDLAASSGEDLATSADIAASVLRGFGMEAEDAGHVADVLAKNAAATNAAVYDTGEAMKYVAPLANTMGLSFEEVAASIGLMSNAGIKGSQAGTTLRGALSRLAKPTEVMQVTMDELGLSFYDSEGKMKSLTEMITMLQTNMSGLTEEQQQNALVTLFGQEALSGMMVLLEAGPDALAELTEAYENCDGAAADMAKTMLDNLKGAVEEFGGAVETAQINLFDRFAPAMKTAVQEATKLVNSFNLLDDSTKDTIYKVVALAAATGPAMVGLGGIVGAVGKLIPLMTALASPVGIVATGMALFAVASVDASNEIGKGFVKLSKKLKTSLADINKRITNSIKTVSNRIPVLAKSLSDGLGELVPEAMNTALLVVTGFADTIADNASSIAEVGKTIITSIVGGISSNLPQLIPAGARMVVNIGSALVRNIPSLLSSVGELVKSIGNGLRNVDWSSLGIEILDAIGTAFTETKDLFAGWFSEAQEAVKAIKWTDVWNSIKNSATITSDWLKNLILGDAATDTSTWKDVGAKIWTSIKSGISTAGDWIKQLVLGENFTPDASWSEVGASIWSTIQNGIKTTGDWIKQLVLKDAFTADSSWGDVGKKIIEKISSGMSGLDSETLINAIGDLTAVAEGIAGKIVQSKADWAAAAGTFIANLVEGLTSYNLWDSLATSFATIATSILNGITAAIPGLSNVAVDIIEAVGGLLTGANGDSLMNGMTTIAQAIIDGIVSALPTLTTAAVSIVSALGTLLGSINWSGAIDSVTVIGEAILSAVAEGIKSAGTVVVGIVDALGSALENINWNSITVSLDGFATMLINGIVKGIESLSTATTSIVTAIGDLISDIDWSEFGDHAQIIGGTLIDGIVSGIQNLTSGATDIVAAIGDVLGQINWAEMGDAAASLATSLFDGIVAGLGKLDFNDFLSAIGSGIAAAGEGLGEAAGAIVNNLVTYILTPENWLKLIELGGKLIEGIAVGILNLGKGILEGAWGFVEGVLKGLFEGLGFEFNEWSEETTAALDETVTIINNSGDEITTSLENAITNMSTIDWVGGMNTGSLSTAMQSWAFVVENGTEELIASLDEYAFLGCEEITNLFQILCDETASAADRAAAMIALNDLGFGDFVRASFASCDKDITAAARRMSENGVTTFEDAFSVLGITIPEAVQTGLDAGMPLVEASATAVANAASTANDKATAEAAAGATGTAVDTELAAKIDDGQTDVENSATGVVDAATLALETLPDAASIIGEDGVTGMSDAIDNNAAQVETAMSNMASNAVMTALQEMNYATGYATGFDYVMAIREGMEAAKANTISAIKMIATAVCTAASNTLSYSAGYSLGINFDSGIAAGVKAGSSAIKSAAKSAANAALAAAKKALGIHSPSTVAEKEVGWMYDEGIAEGLLGKLSVIRKAGSEVAASMHDLFFVEDPSRGTVYSSKNTINQTAKRTAEATSENKSTLERAEAVGKAIADRLIETGALDGDIYMDGEKVGEKVTKPVSKKIAQNAKKTVKGRSSKVVLA